MLTRFGLEVNMKMRKFVFAIYCVLIAVLSIGWYPESEEEPMININEMIKPVRKTADAIMTLAENGKFCYQGIRESEEAERMTGMQQDEEARRAVKTVVRYRIPVNKDSRRIMERIVEAEAGDQNVAGRQMVANVIINRIKSKNFPNSVKGVVFAHRQFSPVSNGSYYRVSVSDLTKKAVERALKEKDNTKGALYFMYRAGSDAKNIRWFDRDLTRLYKYGCHEFFK